MRILRVEGNHPVYQFDSADKDHQGTEQLKIDNIASELQGHCPAHCSFYKREGRRKERKTRVGMARIEKKSR